MIAMNYFKRGKECTKWNVWSVTYRIEQQYGTVQCSIVDRTVDRQGWHTSIGTEQNQSNSEIFHTVENGKTELEKRVSNLSKHWTYSSDQKDQINCIKV